MPYRSSSIFIGTAIIGSTFTTSTFGDGCSFFSGIIFLMDSFLVRPYSTFLEIDLALTGSLTLGDWREIGLFPYLADPGFLSELPGVVRVGELFLVV